MTIETPRQDIASVQMLRGLAALMIVIVHISTQLRRHGHETPWPEWLNGGVDIFFVISGFIMWVTTEAKPNRTGRQFIEDRIIRVVPLYWCITTVLVVMMVVAPRILQTASFDISHIVSSYLFLPHEHPTSAVLWPVVVPGWTLNYEMFFYALFAVAIATSGGSARKRLTHIALFLATSIGAGMLLSKVVPEAAFYANGIILEFLMGIALGVVYLKRRPGGRGEPHWLWLTAAGVFFLGLSDTYDLPRVIEMGLPALAIVSGAVFAGELRFEPLERLGDTSYSLYLSHVITLSAAGQAWRFIGASPLHPSFFVFAAIASSIVVGAGVYYLIERPLTRASRAAIAGRRQSTKRPGAQPRSP